MPGVGIRLKSPTVLGGEVINEWRHGGVKGAGLGGSGPLFVNRDRVSVRSCLRGVGERESGEDDNRSLATTPQVNLENGGGGDGTRRETTSEVIQIRGHCMQCRNTRRV
jgi:hypothetical protein